MTLLKPRRWLGYQISINDLIPEAERILDLFETSEIPLSDSFGSSSMEPVRPHSVILAFGPGTEPERLAELLDLLPASAIHHLQASTEGHSRKTIYIGSYNFDKQPVAAVSPELLRVNASTIFPLTIRS